ncbi:MAG: xanthine dehydrogenase family protein molybdopterin-binding subunit [Nitriliruptorales bacterium]|nr:xanthine dehydrogenase family protein molybdopterin-binding subunit [Nitriliruptorales bacterium]
MQSTSWSTMEQVRFSTERILSDSWDSYPILQFSDVPEVKVTVLDRPDEPSLGAGEIAQGPTAAAIGNAVYHALGLRVRDLPMTSARIADLAGA